MAGVITASEPSWITPFAGLSPHHFGKLVTAVRRQSVADGHRGRPWSLSLEDPQQCGADLGLPGAQGTVSAVGDGLEDVFVDGVEAGEQVHEHLQDTAWDRASEAYALARLERRKGDLAAAGRALERARAAGTGGGRHR